MTEIEDIRFGWRKDRFDERDHLVLKGLHPITKKPVALPESVDLSAFLPTIRDQLQEGSCVGHGIGGALTATMNIKGVFKEWASVRDIYNGARFVGGYLDEEGAYPSDACKWVTRKTGGVLPEHFWKYIDDYDESPPSLSLDVERIKLPVPEYIRVVDSLDGIKTALAAKYPVAFGGPWFDTWFDAPKGKLPKVTTRTRVAGGHETYIYGFSNAREEIDYVNSWGELWGDKGKYHMPMQALDVMKKVAGYDAHIFNVPWGGAPVPVQKKLLKVYDNGTTEWVSA